MDAATLADKIKQVKERLAEIQDERAGLAGDDFAKKSELLDEEHTLQAQLEKLQDESAEQGVGIAEKQAGDASDYERVPDLPDDNGIESVDS